MLKHRIIAAAIIMLVLVYFGGCSKTSNPMMPDENVSQIEADNATTSNINLQLLEVVNSIEAFETRTGIVKFSRKDNAYKSMVLGHPNGTVFEVKKGSLTPPSYIPFGTPVPIFMTITRTADEVIYTFGPSGCQFSPMATVWISWKDTGWDNADLYYIEKDGTYTPQEADEIDTVNKRMKISIPHFSRYAMAHSE